MGRVAGTHGGGSACKWFSKMERGSGHGEIETSLIWRQGPDLFNKMLWGLNSILQVMGDSEGSYTGSSPQSQRCIRDRKRALANSLVESTLLGLEKGEPLRGHSSEPECKTWGLRVVSISTFTWPLSQVLLCSVQMAKLQDRTPPQKNGLRDVCQNNGRGYKMKRKL